MKKFELRESSIDLNLAADHPRFLTRIDFN